MSYRARDRCACCSSHSKVASAATTRQLASLLARTGVCVAAYRDGTITAEIRAHGRAQPVVVTILVGEGAICIIRTPLETQASESAGSEDALLRLSYAADYIKVMRGEAGNLVLACELPLEIIDAVTLHAATRSLAQLAVASGRAVRSPGGRAAALGGLASRQRPIRCRVDPRRELRRLTQLAHERAEERPLRLSGMAIAITVARGAGELYLHGIAREAGITLLALFDIRPSASQREALLTANALACVARGAVDDDGNLVLMYETPLVTPRLLEAAEREFGVLLDHLQELPERMERP